MTMRSWFGVIAAAVLLRAGAASAATPAPASITVAGGTVTHNLSTVNFTLGTQYIAQQQIDRTITIVNNSSTGERLLYINSDVAYPTGVDLYVQVSGIGNGSAGWVQVKSGKLALTNTPLDVGTWSGTISFRLAASPTAAPVFGTTRSLSVWAELGAADVYATVPHSITLGQLTAISASPGTPSLVIGSVVAGTGLVSATHVSTSTYYLVGTNYSNLKMTARLDSNMPANTSLEVSAAPPPGGTALGWVTLTFNTADIVTGIGKVVTPDTAGSRCLLSYRFSATAAAGALSTTRTITFTLTAGS